MSEYSRQLAEAFTELEVAFSEALRGARHTGECAVYMARGDECYCNLNRRMSRVATALKGLKLIAFNTIPAGGGAVAFVAPGVIPDLAARGDGLFFASSKATERESLALYAAPSRHEPVATLTPGRCLVHMRSYPCPLCNTHPEQAK